jgi:hypothetical protein
MRYAQFTALSLGCLLLGGGCAQTPHWIPITVDQVSLSIPYSPEWKISAGELPPYQIDEIEGAHKTIRFGRLVDKGTAVTREYYLYYEEKQTLDSLKDSLSCADGYESRITKIGNIEGIDHHVGGAKGCAAGFAFNNGQRTYFIYHLSNIGDPASEITDEMKQIIQSVRE